MRYRVTAVVRSTLQIVVQARNLEEAEAFADDIDFEKWSLINTEHETVDVTKDYFLKRLKIEQESEPLSGLDRPPLTIVSKLE